MSTTDTQLARHGTPEEQPLTQRPANRISSRNLSPWSWGLVLIIVGVVDVWGSRYNLNPDGISYIEMAKHAIAGAPDGLINGYWSPGYPILLAPFLSLSGHDWTSAIPVLHIVNLIIFGLAGWLMVWLLRRDPRIAEPGAGRYATAFGITAFLFVAIKSIGLGLLTPDFAVMLAVLAAAGCCMQLERSAQPWRWAVPLGLILGVGYWLKGIMLPLNAILLLGLFVLPPRRARARQKVMVAGAVFALVALPLIIMVSARVGRPTVGEVGRLNYAWEIDGVTPFTGWVGDSDSSHGIPIHPPRVLQAEPQTLEFANPINATFALWFDPSYWYAGARAHFDAGSQWRVLRQGFADLWLVLQQQILLPIGVLVLFLCSTSAGKAEIRPRTNTVLALWGGIALVVYAMVHVEPRYLAGFIAIEIVVAWTALVRRTPRPVMRWALGVLVIVMLGAVAQNIDENTGGYQTSYRPDYILDANNLHDAGIARGDRVAMVGDAFEAYAAFGAGTPITVQVVDSTGFWQLTPAGRSDLQHDIASAGVKALLANNVANDMIAEGWRLFPRDDGSNLGLLVLAPR